MIFDYVIKTRNGQKNIVTLENPISIDFADDFFYFEMINLGWQFTVPLRHIIN